LLFHLIRGENRPNRHQEGSQNPDEHQTGTFQEPFWDSPNNVPLESREDIPEKEIKCFKIFEEVDPGGSQIVTGGLLPSSTQLMPVAGKTKR
jgi:hypothetical protein